MLLMSRMQSKRQQGRHRAFLRAVRKSIPMTCPFITESEIRRYLGKHMDIQKAAEAFIASLDKTSDRAS